jgi:imidazolonepropionase-like amidohydrolase
VRLPLSLTAGIALVLFVQFLVLPRLFHRLTPASLALSEHSVNRLMSGLEKCAGFNSPRLTYPVPDSTRINPRWFSSTGRHESIVLRNATLFDGESWVDGPVDIRVSKGVVVAVSPTSGPRSSIYDDGQVAVFELNGRHVTPGLVDMHSHHLAMSWPLLEASDDTNEVNPATGPLTPFVRALDSIKPYDVATTIIASGGITSSLILPGSANIVGGEGFMVKNALRSGRHKEEVVEELLLEHGIPPAERRRYMKMACGENPKRTYRHTRMGNAWVFRKHMTRARELLEKQDAWCLSAAAALESNDAATIAKVATVAENEIDMVEALEFDSTVAMLRGKIGVNVHCYEPEDMEGMIERSKEFGFRIQAFHHALR